MANPTNEQVQFRLLPMPCCGTLICWVNPRRPSFCPECGTSVFRHYDRAKWSNTFSAAWLRIEDADKANFILREENNVVVGKS
jgi:hypothetical protein